MARVLFILLTTASVYAQSFELSSFGGGGISTAWGKRFPLENTESIFGGSAGLIFSYNFDDINTIRLETQYDQKGAIESGIKKPLHYITISPMMQFYVHEKVKFYFLIGQFTGFLINQTGKNPFDLGVVLGMGYKQNLFKKKLFIFLEMKDYFGLMNTSDFTHTNSNKFNGSLGLSYSF